MKMKLMTKEIEKEFKKIGRQEDVKDPIVVCKFFNPSGAGTWLATELYYVIRRRGANGEEEIIEVEASKTNGQVDGKIVDMNFYGYVSIFGDHNDEWGYFSLSELGSVKGPFGLGIERDLYFDPQPISKACPKASL
jgi:hypothetical protein